MRSAAAGAADPGAGHGHGRAERASLGDRSAEIIAFVRQHPDGVPNKEVREKFGDAADQYLKRLCDTGRLVRVKRGLYRVSEVSEVSETQVSGPENPDTGLWGVSEVSETSEQDSSWPPGSIGEQASQEPAEGDDQ